MRLFTWLASLLGLRHDAPVPVARTAPPSTVGPNRTFLVSELHRLLVGLAGSGEEALEQAPEGSCRPDELALDYDNYVHAFLDNFGHEVTSQQRDALLQVDELFTAMSGPHQSDLWTEEAVISSPRWAQVRTAARKALEAVSDGRLWS